MKLNTLELIFEDFLKAVNDEHVNLLEFNYPCWSYKIVFRHKKLPYLAKIKKILFKSQQELKIKINFPVESIEEFKNSTFRDVREEDLPFTEWTIFKLDNLLPQIQKFCDCVTSASENNSTFTGFYNKNKQIIELRSVNKTNAEKIESNPEVKNLLLEKIGRVTIIFSPSLPYQDVYDEPLILNKRII